MISCAAPTLPGLYFERFPSYLPSKLKIICCVFYLPLFFARFFTKMTPQSHLRSICFSPQQYGLGLFYLRLGLFKKISVRIQPRLPQVRGVLRSGDIARRRGRSPVAILHCLLSIFAHVFTRIFLGLGLTLNADCAVLNYSRDLFLYYFR